MITHSTTNLSGEIKRQRLIHIAQEDAVLDTFESFVQTKVGNLLPNAVLFDIVTNEPLHLITTFVEKHDIGRDRGSGERHLWLEVEAHFSGEFFVLDS